MESDLWWQGSSLLLRSERLWLRVTDMGLGSRILPDSICVEWEGSLSC